MKRSGLSAIANMLDMDTAKEGVVAVAGAAAGVGIYHVVTTHVSALSTPARRVLPAAAIALIGLFLANRQRDLAKGMMVVGGLLVVANVVQHFRGGAALFGLGNGYPNQPYQLGPQRITASGAPGVGMPIVHEKQLSGAGVGEGVPMGAWIGATS